MDMHVTFEFLGIRDNVWIELLDRSGGCYYNSVPAVIYWDGTLNTTHIYLIWTVLSNDFLLVNSGIMGIFRIKKSQCLLIDIF